VVTTLRIILVLFRGAAILFAVLSVYYWFRASTVTVTDADKRYDPKFDFVVNDPDHKADDVNFFATAKEQSRFNKIAAIYTALAILCEAVVTVIS
jgi:hypothetical protein